MGPTHRPGLGEEPLSPTGMLWEYVEGFLAGLVPGELGCSPGTWIPLAEATVTPVLGSGPTSRGGKGAGE